MEKPPLFNYIELSLIDLCNRKCSFCPRADGEISPMQNLQMTPTLYNKIATELGDIPGVTVMLAGYGEPLLHKNVLDCINKLSQTSTVKMVSNGDVLTPKMIVDLYAAGLSLLAISIYEPSRKPVLIELFKDHDPAKYELRDRWDTGLFILTNRGGTVYEKTKPGECYYMSYSMTMDWNGDVFLCPQDWNRRIKLGNAMCSTLMEIWDSKIAHNWRKRLLNGDRSQAPCNKCDVMGTKKGQIEAAKWKTFYGIE